MEGYYPPDSFYPPAKRIRPNPREPSSPASGSVESITPPPPRSITPIEAAVLSLPPPTLKAILLHSAQSHPDIAAQLYAAHNDLILAESRKVVNFDHLSKSAWHALNPRYKGSGSKQYEMAFEAASEVEECIAAIDKGSGDMTSFGTKKSAVETLRKIGKSILLADDTLGYEVRKQFQWNQGVDVVMLRILMGMKAEERAALRAELEEKCRELWQMAGEECIFDKLPEVIRVLTEDDGEEDESVQGSQQEGVCLPSSSQQVPTIATHHHQ